MVCQCAAEAIRVCIVPLVHVGCCMGRCACLCLCWHTGVLAQARAHRCGGSVCCSSFFQEMQCVQQGLAQFPGFLYRCGPDFAHAKQRPGGACTGHSAPALLLSQVVVQTASEGCALGHPMHGSPSTHTAGYGQCDMASTSFAYAQLVLWCLCSATSGSVLFAGTKGRMLCLPAFMTLCMEV
jgi:hypothetical protein